MFSKVLRQVVALAILCWSPSAFPLTGDAPALIRALNQDFEGFFLLTTDGNGDYEVYQRIEDSLGLNPDSDLVCMTRGECYLDVASVPKASVIAFSSEQTSLGELRRRFAAVRDAYKAMHSSERGDATAAVDKWRSGLQHMRLCLRTPAQRGP
jgi:hypothetical protein